jgi:hypothetical protein
MTLSEPLARFLSERVFCAPDEQVSLCEYEIWVRTNLVRFLVCSSPANLSTADSESDGALRVNCYQMVVKQVRAAIPYFPTAIFLS